MGWKYIIGVLWVYLGVEYSEIWVDRRWFTFACALKIPACSTRLVGYLARYIHRRAFIFFRFTKQNIVVRLGEYDFTTNNETQYIDYRLTDIRLHPDYDHATHANDIAIVKLNRPAVYNSFIRPICVAKTNMEVYKKNAVVAGKNLDNNSFQNKNVPV